MGDVKKLPLTGSLTLKSAVVVDATQSGGGRALRTADDVQSASHDFVPGAPPAFSLQGKSRQGRDGELEACSLLLQALASKGRAYFGLRQVEDSDYPGVDCVAEGADEVFCMQVTRAAYGDFRAELATAADKKVVRTYESADQAADEIRDAIDDKFKDLVLKRRLSIANIVLVLDSRETLAHVNPDVVASFARRHAEWTKKCGFREVCLVGPAIDYVFQLA